MWHQSRSNPNKVYDSRHVVACIAESPELAAFIVGAANAFWKAGATVPLRLQEPAVQAPEPEQPTDMVDEDSCCQKRLIRALRAGLASDPWQCPECGCQWHGKTNTESSVRRWSPVVEISVIPGRV